MMRIKLRAGAWTRQDKVGRINRMVLSRMPMWTEEQVVNIRRRAEELWESLQDLID